MIFGIIIKQHQNTPSVRGNIGTLCPSRMVDCASGHYVFLVFWWSLQSNDLTVLCTATLNFMKGPSTISAARVGHMKINNFLNLPTDWILHNLENNEENDYFHNCHPDITIINKHNTLLGWVSDARPGRGNGRLRPGTMEPEIDFKLNSTLKVKNVPASQPVK